MSALCVLYSLHWNIWKLKWSIKLIITSEINCKLEILQALQDVHKLIYSIFCCQHDVMLSIKQRFHLRILISYIVTFFFCFRLCFVLFCFEQRVGGNKFGRHTATRLKYKTGCGGNSYANAKRRCVKLKTKQTKNSKILSSLVKTCTRFPLRAHQHAPHCSRAVRDAHWAQTIRRKECIHVVGYKCT